MPLPKKITGWDIFLKDRLIVRSTLSDCSGLIKDKPRLHFKGNPSQFYGYL